MKTYILTLPLLCLLSACSGVDAGAQSQQDVPVDSVQQRLVPLLQDAAYKEELSLYNEEVFPSDAVANSGIRLYISDEGLVDYQAISAGEAGKLPVGTVLVREVLDQDEKIKKLTVIVQGEDGSNPDVGDLWFAEADPEGTWLEDSEGEPRTGALSDCQGCHMTRRDSAFLFGARL